MTTLTKAQQWQLAIPKMGYMGLLRNLAGMDRAGISDELAAQVAAKLADPAEVAKSQQLPFRYLSAYLEAPSLRWGHALEQATKLSLQRVPELPGRNLVLIDTSGSMENTLSKRSKATRVKAAALFGLALAVKNAASTDLWGFADGQFQATNAGPGMAILKAVEVFCRCVGNVGHGTRIEEAVRATYRNHNRVLIFTDMQTFPRNPRISSGTFTYGVSYGQMAVGDVSSAVPGDVPVYGFNLAGYTHSAMPVSHRNRHELGGLTDHTFALINAIENNQRGVWPWEN